MATFHWKSNGSAVKKDDTIYNVWTASKWNELINFCNGQMKRIWDENEDKKYEDAAYEDEYGWHYPHSKKDYDTSYNISSNYNANKEEVITAAKYNGVVEGLARQLSYWSRPRYSAEVISGEVIYWYHADNLEKDANTLGGYSIN